MVTCETGRRNLREIGQDRLVSHRPLTASLVLAASVGGAAGAVARWLLGQITPDGPGFPWTTFAINVIGSLALAALPAVGLIRRRPALAIGLGPGVLGGFTTLSAYAEQSRALLAQDRSVLAASYLLGTLAACLVAVRLAHALSSPAAQVEFEDEEGNE